MTPLGKHDMYYVSVVEHVQTAFSLLTAGSKRIRLLVSSWLSFFLQLSQCAENYVSVLLPSYRVFNPSIYNCFELI